MTNSPYSRLSGIEMTAAGSTLKSSALCTNMSWGAPEEAVEVVPHTASDNTATAGRSSRYTRLGRSLDGSRGWSLLLQPRMGLFKSAHLAGLALAGERHGHRASSGTVRVFSPLGSTRVAHRPRASRQGQAQGAEESTRAWVSHAAAQLPLSHVCVL
jgi:hypothetical protein